MRIDLEHMREGFLAVQAGKKSRHAVDDRIKPSRWQYDYLTLSRLTHDVEALVREAPRAAAGARALDLGADKSPYRDLLQSRGYEVRTLDITRDNGADYAGTAEATGLPDCELRPRAVHAGDRALHESVGGGARDPPHPQARRIPRRLRAARLVLPSASDRSLAVHAGRDGAPLSRSGTRSP